MKLVWNIVRKDFRHLRLYLAGWLGVAMLQVVSWPESGIYNSRPDISFYQGIFLVLTITLQIFLLTAIVARLVQSDSILGSTAFWLSRPVSGGQLLTSKLVFLLMILVLPSLLLEVLVHSRYGVTPADLLRSIPQIVLWQLCVVAVLMVFAVLTRDLTRMFLLTLGCLVASSWITTILPSLFGSGGADLPSTFATLEASRWIAMCLFSLAVSALVLACQYLLRRTRVSMILSCLGFFLFCLSMEYWTWDFLASELRPDRRIIDAEQVTARVEQGSLQFHRKGDRLKVLHGVIGLNKVPSDLVIEPIRIVSHLAQPSRNGRVSHADQNPYLVGNDPIWGGQESGRRLDEQKAERLAKALGGIRLLDSELPHLPGYRPNLLQITDETWDRYLSGPAELSIDVVFLVQRDKITTMRPEKGGRLDRGSDHALIVQVTTRKNTCRVVLKELGHRLVLDKAKSRLYVLRNSSRKEALLGQERGAYSRTISALYPFVPRVIESSEQTIEFSLPSGDLELGPDWFQEAEFVRIETSILGHFSKSVRLDDFFLGRVPVL